MSEIKQIVINRNLHKNLKTYCAEQDQQIKEYTEAVLEYAIGKKLTVEELKEKQYKDSYASTATGGPMLRYGGVTQEEEEIAAEDAPEAPESNLKAKPVVFEDFTIDDEDEEEIEEIVEEVEEEVIVIASNNDEEDDLW